MLSLLVGCFVRIRQLGQEVNRVLEIVAGECRRISGQRLSNETNGIRDKGRTGFGEDGLRQKLVMEFEVEQATAEERDGDRNVVLALDQF
jgi:hypothetical protein